MFTIWNESIHSMSIVCSVNAQWIEFIYLFNQIKNKKSIQFNSIQVYLYSAFYDCKAALQEIKFLQYINIPIPLNCKVFHDVLIKTDI